MNLMPDFRCHRPATLEEAVRLKAASAGTRFVAGGTDLLVNLRRGLDEPSDLIDLTAVADLAAIRREGDSLWLGAGATLADLARHPEVLAFYPAVAEAALAVAGPTHRAAATLGGNLCQDTRCIFYNQSEWWREANDYCLKHKGDKCHVVPKSDRCYATYHGDIAPVLMVLDAEAVVAGPDGVRRVKMTEFYREDGGAHLTLAAGEALAAVVLPPQGGRRAAYAKARIRDAIDFPLAGVAVALKRDGDVIGDLKVAITGDQLGAAGHFHRRADRAGVGRRRRRHPCEEPAQEGQCAAHHGDWGDLPPAGDAGPGPAAGGYAVGSGMTARLAGAPAEAAARRRYEAKG